MCAARVLLARVLLTAVSVLAVSPLSVAHVTEVSSTPGAPTTRAPPPPPLRPEYAHPAGAEALDPYRAEAEREHERENEHEREKEQEQKRGHDERTEPDGERLLRGAADDPPMFLLEPQPAYVLRLKPATIRCRAANALEVYVECGGSRAGGERFEFVDPQSGVRIVESEVNVTRNRHDAYFGSEPFACSCHAWSSRGHITSPPARVQLAYIKKSFPTSPAPVSVSLGARAVLRCVPPAGAPPPLVSWTRHGLPLRTDSTGDRHDLVIARATLQDMANYSCVAENVAGKRVSEPALLTVYVNGGWSAWSSWAPCRCGGVVGAGARRVRTCSDPAPLNGGAPCAGPATQRTHECALCPHTHNTEGHVEPLPAHDHSQQLLVGGGGGWGSWGAWSACGADCRRRRVRSCITDCAGPADQHAACTGDLCGDHGVSGGAVALYCAAAALLAALAAGAALVLRAHRTGRARRALYAITRTAEYPSGAFSAAEKAALAGPDLTRQPDPHHYDVPNLATSYSSPMDQQSGPRSRSDDYDAKPYSESEHSASSCFTSSGSSAGSGGSGGAVTLRLAELVADSAVSRSAAVGAGGARAALPAGGVSLGVPAGAVRAGERVYVSLVRDDRYRPRLGPGVTVLSPVVRCGPPRSGMARPAVLELPHCARLEPGAWSVTLLAADAAPGPVAWSRAAHCGAETVGTPALIALESARALVLTDALAAFVLVGEGARGAGKALRLLVGAAEPGPLDRRVDLRVYLLEDTPCAALAAEEAERRAGGSVWGDAALVVRRGGADVRMQVEGLAGWCTGQVADATVSVDELWASGGRSTARWTLSVERGAGAGPLLARVLVEQGDEACEVTVDGRGGRVVTNPLCTGSGEGSNALEPGVRARLAAVLESDGGWRRLAGWLGVRYPTWLAARGGPADLLLEVWETRAGREAGPAGLRAALEAAGLGAAARVLEDT